MTDRMKSLEVTIEHLKGVIHHADEIVTFEREQHIITRAQRDKALAENTKLKNQQGAELQALREQVKRQMATISRQDTEAVELARAVNIMAERIKQLEAIIDEQARVPQRLAPVPSLYENCDMFVNGAGLRRLMTDYCERATALGNAQTRINYLQSENARLIRADRDKIPDIVWNPHPGRSYVLKPKCVTIHALFVGDIPATFEYRNPRQVTLTF